MIIQAQNNILKALQYRKQLLQNSYKLKKQSGLLQQDSQFSLRQLNYQIKYHQINIVSTQLMTKKQEYQELMASKKKKEKDRYGIFKINDIDELFELSRNRRLNLSLNDYVSIFLRVTELRLDSTLKSLYGLSEIQKKIEKEIQKADEEEPSIGRLSLCLSRSKLCEDINFWIILSDHILANRFDCDYDEVYAAMLGFNGVRQYCQHEWQIELIEKVYMKLEIALIHHLKMQKYNIKSLRLICDVMYQNGRFTPDFLKEIEYLLNYQLMEASNNFGSNESLISNSQIKEEILFPQFGVKYNDQLLQLLSSFAYFFSKSNFDSLLLFNFTTFYVTECIKRQHIFEKLIQRRKLQLDALKAQEFMSKLNEDANKTDDQQQKNSSKNDENQTEEILEELINPLLLDGSGLASLLYFWDFMLIKNPQLILPNEIRSWLLVEIQQEDRVYDLEDLNILYKNLDLLHFNEVDKAKFYFFLEKKLFDVDCKTQQIMIEHIKEYLEIRSGLSYASQEEQEEEQQQQKNNQNKEQILKEAEEDLRQISKPVYSFLDNICQELLFTFSPYSVYYFLHHIDQYEQIKYFPNFLNKLPEYVLLNIEKYEFDEICYFVLMCYQNQDILGDMSTTSFWSNIYLIKEHIKSIAFSRGFKLDPSSYFCQLLHKIDMAEFFQGGEQ
ncbi:hypothetical protein ABPG73_020241 [Tetrahymena malaccensis]